MIEAMRNQRGPACPLCGHAESVVLLRSMIDRSHPFVKSRGTVAHCPACAIAFTSLSQDADAYPSGYAPHSLSERSSSSRRRTRDRIRSVFYEGRGSLFDRIALVLPYLIFRLRDRYKLRNKALYENAFRRRGRLLDVGCGAGSWLAMWSRKQSECVGVEPHAPTARLARKRLGLDIRPGTLEEQHFPDESFDAISLCHSLEHIDKPRETILEVRRILKPDGEIVIWVPNYGSLLRPLFGRDWMAYDIPRHLWHFTPARLTALIKDCGLAPVEITMDPNEHIFRGSVALARQSGRRGLAWLLDHRSIRMMLGIASAWLRRADYMRVRARKA